MDRKDKVDIDSDEENDAENNNEDDDWFDPIPIENTPRKLLLVYQSPDMKWLYCCYGSILILLVATYKTCKYSLPLFFLVNQTNVNPKLVFVAQEEIFEMISQVLKISRSIVFFSLFFILNSF